MVRYSERYRLRACPYVSRKILFVCLTFLIMRVTSSHWHAVQLFGRRSLSEEHGRLRNNPFSWSGTIRPGTPPLLRTEQFRRRRRRSPIWMLPCCSDWSRAESAGTPRGMCPLWSWGRMCRSATGPRPASWSCAPCLNDGYIYVTGWFFVGNQSDWKIWGGEQKIQGNKSCSGVKATTFTTWLRIKFGKNFLYIFLEIFYLNVRDVDCVYMGSNEGIFFRYDQTRGT
jgi:hypothetical protein